MDWSNRDHRIQRLKEKGTFDRVIMPFFWIGMTLGLLLLGWQGVEKLDGGRCTNEVLLAGLLLVVSPFPVLLFRYLRGHFRRRLQA
ncbi:MAG: hypothetical protein EBT68_02550 [Verrucomicrobia bacterium]|nr:hypothetical protein [Verrucomicrobiota bacterium]